MRVSGFFKSYTFLRRYIVLNRLPFCCFTFTHLVHLEVRICTISLSARLFSKVDIVRSMVTYKDRVCHVVAQSGLIYLSRMIVACAIFKQIDIDFRSIRDAEERAQLFLNQRKLRLSSQSRHRQQHHAETLRKVHDDVKSQDRRTWQKIVDKKKKFEQWSTERHLALEKARSVAKKTADLRHAIK